jgi:uncharacterized protein with FMN-binding domain
MKKTLSLLGLFFVGLALLANPNTGILAAVEDTPTAATAEATTTVSGDPPPEAAEDNLPGSTTTTVEEPTTTEIVVQTAPYTAVGSVEPSRFGNFQVEAVFEDGVLVDVVTLQLPTDRKSTSINDYAVPRYEEAVLDAQSADVDIISGATVTWTGYTDSLQSALDEAAHAA